ncbi:META domain-containing protein [Chryseobacterium oryctis]|uniref:META domain-containing protein n=1 Tax=Chryseobacterium oryctis TaxID=2952618 RepID=A0ABT3HLF4_9FLAO|nr:META domain-containing protein [Chryseobacterium oryctis]MCW3160601.1 META domain-containing protein [Chryseobacterium oryctis]
MKNILLSILTFLFLGMVWNCTPTKGKDSQNITEIHKIQREWMLVSFGDFSKPELIKNKAKISLTGKIENEKIKGTAFMGCNTMFFTSEFKKDGSVKFSDIGGTLMACQDMELELYFSEKFKNMTKYSIEGHFLTLTDDNGNSMRFIASDWD